MSNARVTSQVLEVLISDTSVARVTSQVLEVLLLVGSKVSFSTKSLVLTGNTFDIDAELAFITASLVLIPGQVLDPSSVEFNQGSLSLTEFTFLFPEDINFSEKALILSGQTFQAIEINGKVFSTGSIVVNGINFETKLSFGSTTSKFFLDF